MSEINSTAKKRDAIHASRVRRTALFCNVSERLVYKVLGMERNNELVVAVFMTLAEKEREIEKEMVQLVKELVPFDQAYKSATPRKQHSNSTACNKTTA